MTLLAMNWKAVKPPRDFVGFALEYKEPGEDRFWIIKNRISFPNADGSVNLNRVSSRLAPIQKFQGSNRRVAGERQPAWFER